MINYQSQIDWATNSLNVLDRALLPDGQERVEARAAGISERRIELLYPRTYQSYGLGIAMMTLLIGSDSWLRPPLEELNLFDSNARFLPLARAQNYLVADLLSAKPLGGLDAKHSKEFLLLPLVLHDAVYCSEWGTESSQSTFYENLQQASSAIDRLLASIQKYSPLFPKS